ncbi:probable pleckstrin homology domain-containing family N member 1 isoform X2 [Heptranchias perlo]|uniref:probable pleckstrin homology domain-containing family N member 1 isoform X2 n=1 Tax=Heptranchias perlo TaxID=212740 RepID=UPI00355AB507
MGSNFSCVPKRKIRLNRPKKGTKRKSNRWEQVQQQTCIKSQNELAADRNQDYLSSQAQTRSVKVAKQNDKEEIENRLLHNPIMEWDQSGINLEDLGKVVYCSKVKVSRQPCKDINDRCLVLFQNHLLILSDDDHGFTYQGLLPLAGITVHNVQSGNSNSVHSPEFQITGPLLHPFTVYCSTKEKVKEWLYYLNKQRQVNSKTADKPRVQTCRKLNGDSPGKRTENVDLRTLILNQPIHGGERTRINSLGSIIWISNAMLQHLPFQEQHDRLLILFPMTLLILSEEHHALHYKGELPLNAITISEQDESDSDSSTFLIEGKMINQILVSSQNRTAHKKLIHHLSSAGVTVQKASMINEGCDYKHSPQCSDQSAGKRRPSLESHRRSNSQTAVYGIFTFPQKPVEMISVSENLPALVTENMMGEPVSPDYAEPYTPPPTWFSGPAESLRLTSSAYKHNSSPLPVRRSSLRLSGRKVLALSQPPPLSSTASESLIITENLLSPGYAEPFAASKMQPAPPAAMFSHKDTVNNQDPSITRQRRNIRTSGSDISRLSLASLQPGVATFNCCSPSDECLNITLSPTYAEPYFPLKLQPAPPAKPLRLREPVARHNSSPLPERGGNLKTPLRKTHALSQPPCKSDCVLGKDFCSFTSGRLDIPLTPVYAEPFAASKKQQAPSTVRLSPTGPVSKQNDLLTRDQWSNTQLLPQECLPRRPLPSPSVSGSSSCSHADKEPLADFLSPTYAEPYLPLKLQPAPPVDCFWIREEVSRRGSADFPVHYSKGKDISWYSDDSRFSLTSSEHTYAELESTQDDSDYEFWDFDFKQQVIPHLSPPSLRQLRQRGVVESRRQGMVHRWS